ncbi:unnamed protein product [Effrenium voratum]|nr:unnamed protein product [Effrenium voratum]
MASELGFAPLRGEKAADVTQVAMEELLKEEEKLSAMLEPRRNLNFGVPGIPRPLRKINRALEKLVGG